MKMNANKMNEKSTQRKLRMNSIQLISISKSVIQIKIILNIF